MKKKKRLRKIKAILSMALITIFFAGCITVYNPATGREEWNFFDEKFEINLGNTLAKQMISQTRMIDDSESLAYVRRVGKKVVAVSHRNYLDYSFYIIDSEDINAFAVLGGHIFVNKGLLDMVTEPELAFVLAHEVAHICARHGFKRFQAALGLSLLMAVLSDKPNQKVVADLITEVDKYVSLGFSRKDEYLADSLGVTYAYRAGYDPKAALLVLKRFEEIEREQGAVSMPVFLRSHPKPADRCKAINTKIKELIHNNTPD